MASTDGGPSEVSVSGEHLLEAIPQARAIADIDVHPLRLMPSAYLTLEDAFDVYATAARAVAAGATGVVVSQGTDTIEEISYVLDLLVDFDAPIVFTGAMRDRTTVGTDADANLIGAIAVAVSPDVRGLGVLVYLNEVILPARFARKRHSTALSAFDANMSGPLGYVTEGRVYVLNRPLGRVNIKLPAEAPKVRVATISVAFDDDGAMLRTALQLGYAGLVVVGLGGGHLPSSLAPIVGEVSAAIPVIFTSRTIDGETLSRTYRYQGSEIDLTARGAISSGALDATHAAILLRLLLMAGVPSESIAEAFQQASHPRGRVMLPFATPRRRSARQPSWRKAPRFATEADGPSNRRANSNPK